MRIPWARGDRPQQPNVILANGDSAAPWAFVEGSISITASIVMADAIARCSRCDGWPLVSYFKRLTEQEDGVIIAGMALLFPTALTIYLVGKMVFSAYREYKRWWESYKEERFEQGRQEGRQEGREEERARMKRDLAERGVSLEPEAERILFGENDTTN